MARASLEMKYIYTRFMVSLCFMSTTTVSKRMFMSKIISANGSLRQFGKRMFLLERFRRVKYFWNRLILLKHSINTLYKSYYIIFILRFEILESRFMFKSITTTCKITIKSQWIPSSSICSLKMYSTHKTFNRMIQCEFILLIFSAFC